MDMIIAKRGDCFYYSWDGYLYNSNKKTEHKVYVKCHKSECGARGHFPRDAARGCGITLRNVQHCHPPEHEFIEEMKFRQELRRVAQQQPDLPMQFIYEEVAARYPNLSDKVSYKCSRALMKRHKSKEEQQSFLSAIDDFNQQDEDPISTKREDVVRPPRSHSEQNEDVHLMLVGDVIEQGHNETDDFQGLLHERSSGSSTELLKEKQELEKKLREILTQLDAANARLTSVAFNSDPFDVFGKYVASLLRGLPPATVIKLKQQMIESILTATLAQQKVKIVSLTQLKDTSKNTQESKQKKVSTDVSNVDTTTIQPVVEIVVPASVEHNSVMIENAENNRSNTCSPRAASNYQPFVEGQKRKRIRYVRSIRPRDPRRAEAIDHTYNDIEVSTEFNHFDEDQQDYYDEDQHDE